jgi:hypothetical protein
MTQPLKLKEFGCDLISFQSQVERKDLNFEALKSKLAELAPRGKNAKRRLPIFLPVDPVNSETDCHLHFVLSTSRRKDAFELHLDLATVPKHKAPQNEDFSVERIHNWLGTALKKPLSGMAFATFEYDEPPYSLVIPLPRSGIVPVESPLIRRSSITGIELGVEQSDIGLRRVFLSKSASSRIEVTAIFNFDHEVNYASFVRLTDYAKKVSTLFVLKEAQP